jgi:hypothetical protein
MTSLQALLFVLDTRTIHNNFNFWKSPGLYIYTTIGNLLLYRVCWWVNIAMWARFDVNYISVLRLSDVKPNLLLVADQTATLLSLYFIDLLLFFRSNTTYSSLNNSFLTYAAPVVMVGMAVLYQVFETVFLVGNERISRGLFNKLVLKNCFSAPFVKVTFRDNYSADVLTSFTRILADAVYGSCWFFTGTFLSSSAFNQNINSHECNGTQIKIIASCVQLVPLIIRFLQCLRNIWDSKLLYPQSLNSLKYLLTILVVISGVGSGNLFNSQSFTLFLITVTALYKWWWDVVMDWGLFDTMPCSLSELQACIWNKNEPVKEHEQPQHSLPRPQPKHVFLRDSLMYPSVSMYYICIVLDLALRFLWVLSLVPQSAFNGFVGYQLNLFVGSMEILRRCMWGALRVEYEHLKLLKSKTPGFLQNAVLRRNSVEVPLAIISGPGGSDPHSGADYHAVDKDSDLGSEEHKARFHAAGDDEDDEQDSDRLQDPERALVRHLSQHPDETHVFLEQLKQFNKSSNMKSFHFPLRTTDEKVFQELDSSRDLVSTDIELLRSSSRDDYPSLNP